MKPIQKHRSTINAIQVKPDLPIRRNSSQMTKKFQSVSKLILNKIDNILTKNTHDDNILLREDDSISTKLSSIKPFNEREVKQKPKLKSKNTFMTDVEVENSKKKSKYIIEKNREVREILNNIDEIDNMFDKNTITVERRKDVEDFKNLIKEIDDFKQDIREEYDELKYLVKFHDKTRGRLSRYKMGVDNVFKQSGLKPKETKNESEDEMNDSDISNTNSDDLNQVFNKIKGINKIKDNLSNIQNGVIDYCQNFQDTVREIEYKKQKK